jgi:serine/threonine-protein kinase
MQDPGDQFKYDVNEAEIVSVSASVIEDRYEILDELGQGGMGVVYKAWHRLLERHVAVKMLHQHVAADEKQLLAMRAEARIIADLQHPNIVQVHAFGTTEDGAPYVVMELLEAAPLSDILKNEDRLSIERCLDLTLQMAHALEFAHAKGIVHRDLKPSNVVITRGPDGGDQVKIVDFGIARRYEQSSTLTQVVGSPMYMSPGQFLGRRGSIRSDLYSLGCVIHETASGAPPFVGETPIETMRKGLTNY